MSEEQARFRKDRKTIQQMLILKLIAEKGKRKEIQVCRGFVDFQKAFDSIKQDITSMALFKSYGVGKRLIKVMKNIIMQPITISSENRRRTGRMV